MKEGRRWLCAGLQVLEGPAIKKWLYDWKNLGTHRER